MADEVTNEAYQLITVKAEELSEGIVDYVLYGKKEELCCWLCLENVTQNNYTSVYDRIVVSSPSQSTMTTFVEILRNIIGNEVDFTEVPHTICKACSSKMIEQYLFMRKCQVQSEYWQKFGTISTEILHIAKTDYDIPIVSDLHDLQTSNSNICDKTGRELRINNSNKMSQTTIICPHCSKEINYNDYKKHISIMHKSVKFASCEKCGKIFVNHGCYQRHKENCSKQTKTWKCLACKENFATEQELLEHKRLQCEGPTCRNCGELLGKETLQTHKLHCVFKKISKRKPAQFKCKFCGIEYVSRPQLRAHVYDLHSPRNKPCSVCGRLFKTTGGLNDHINRHKKEKNFSCDFCSNVFATKRTLTNHLRLHTGVKPHQCFLCDQSFVTTSRRLDHMRKIHWEPQFECEICHKRFAIPTLLKEHIRRHSKVNNRLKMETD